MGHGVETGAKMLLHVWQEIDRVPAQIPSVSIVWMCFR